MPVSVSSVRPAYLGDVSFLILASSSLGDSYSFVECYPGARALTTHLVYGMVVLV